MNIYRTPLSIPPGPSKTILAKLKFFNKNITADLVNKSDNHSYTQTSKGNIKEIFKIKDTVIILSLAQVATQAKT